VSVSWSGEGSAYGTETGLRCVRAPLASWVMTVIRIVMWNRDDALLERKVTLVANCSS
jgi:hypothetical protein